MKNLLLVILCVCSLSAMAGCGSAPAENSSIPGVDTPTPENLLHFIGRASVRIETKFGLVIYIDPATGAKMEYDKPADLVLITHQHSDHNKTNLVTLKDTGKVISCPVNIRSGDTMDFSGIKITAVDAYNNNHSKESCCGFILEINDVVIYHSGDTSKTEQMADFSSLGIDYALLCSDGYYNMGAEEVMEVAGLIDAKYIIPIHSAASGSYSQKNTDKIILENKIVLLPGDEISIGE
ncbi:MAG TPA: MBL fold metallo-hydrolase [Clostridia bacterium]|nr:MBL fold metallo-hydrolase [Clostridia bacterium]HPQ47296.1 MBL fold metallo-hydrolase [Clostridia bacterium]HRX41451.1 MBL fold metallo-hydrolase [Clostridia bacterium]